MHISAVYEQKSQKYYASKDQHRLQLSPLIIKTDSDEYFIPKMLCSLSRGDKKEVLELSQSLLENR